MSRIRFVKMHGAGNDFVMIDDREGVVPTGDRRWLSAVAARGTGIGCEGVILVQKSDSADFRMRFFNPDGSEAELCGNGARCVAAFAREIGAVRADAMRFETLAGDVRAEIVAPELVKIWMPQPKDLRENFVNSGVPHRIVPTTDLAAADVAGEGRRIRQSADFAPEGTNVDFVAYCPPNRVAIRTYERGVEAETGACGTGAVAAALVGVAQHGLSFPVRVATAKGFELVVDGRREGGSFADVALTGPVARVFAGELDGAPRKPEVLAPAGDFTCLQAAIDAGADAVYFGLGTFNMRARSGVNFKPEDLPEIARRCGGRVKRYLTLNAIMFEGEMAEVEKAIVAAKPFVDAFIVSDWGVIALCKKHGVRFHVSTQMSTSNSAAVRFLAAQGAARVVLARECTLAEVAAIVSSVRRSGGPPIDVECFVHGAQCVAESGRCFMSHDAFGTSACRGECKQPCRRRFLVKAVDLYEDADGKPVHESDTAFVVEPHTVLSARDLCSLGFVDKLTAAGVASFKIEGRARNANYVKTVTAAYRRAVDAVADGTYTPALVAELTAAVKTVFHREFSQGLYFGRPGVDQFADSEDSLATTVKRHVGVVVDYFLKAGIAQVKVQDHPLATGDAIQIHGPTTGVIEMTAGELRRDEASVQVCGKGDWVTLKTPRCRVGDKVFFVETRARRADVV